MMSERARQSLPRLRLRCVSADAIRTGADAARIGADATRFGAHATHVGADTRRAANEGGFTLLEVITAIFIFFCGIVGILSLFTTALVLHKTSHDQTVSTMALERIVSEIGVLIEDGALTDSDTGEYKPLEKTPLSGYSGYFYSADFEVADDVENGLVQAHIRITWMSRGREMGEYFFYYFRPGAGQRNEVIRLRAESGGDE